ncbi:MAG TPA: ubiquinone biosynthesis hydroxylase [Xanthobacteraceae bacterium]|jgi:2-octaprenyl-6-methoxyphenol hydroxylase|nr:ubiquinone biosynthesis hydroxylase [Xanthobacteraceae bacterium]
MARDKTDVLIAGGGFAGLTLAIALRQALGSSFAVTVADPALGRTHAGDERASAIVAAARRLFEALGVWERVADEAQPILDMVVTDSRLDDAMRPTFLTFGGEVEPGEPFAHMIENRLLVDALTAKAREAGVELLGTAVAGSGKAALHSVGVTLADGNTCTSRLLVAADGARSAIRDRAGIAIHGWDYDQAAIVINVAHERDHEGRAEEHFLPAGPFAILPLKGRRSSIVWTEHTAEAKRLVALPDAEFHAALEQRFKLHLGELSVIGARRVHPLGFFVARSFIADRTALVGDAAHIIHPIAGQGLNMGLKDVAALAEVITDAARLGLDPGAADVLDRYQRWRRFDTMAMGIATDGLNRLFSNRSDVLRFARDVGLGLVDRLPQLKHLFIREAAGLVGDVPKLLRGEVL